MARVLGDRLIVNVARKPGEEQLIDLMQLFNQNPNRIIAVAGTVGADGAPNTCPITLIYAKDEKTLLVGHPADTAPPPPTCAGTAGSPWKSWEPDDLVMGIQGTMRLIKEPMAMSDAMALWEMRVDKVKQDTSSAQKVIQGPAATPRSDKAVEFEQAAWAELVAAAKGDLEYVFCGEDRGPFPPALSLNSSV